MDFLNGFQGREYNRAQTLEFFYNEQKTIYSLFPVYSKEVDLFFYNMKRLDVFIPIKGTKGNGATTEKRDLKKEVAGLGNIICTRTAAYAIKSKDAVLLANVSARTSEIAELKDGDVLGFANKLSGTVTPLLGIAAYKDYNVTQDMIDTLVEDATTFDNSIGQAPVINHNSSIASKAINAVLKDIRDNIVQFNLLINLFAKDNPDFVEGYYKAVAINYTGIRHNGIEGIITSKATGEIIEGATIIGKGKNKVVVSDLKGAYRLIRIRSGESKVTISAPGYPAQTVLVKYIRGKILTLNIAL